MIRPRLFDRLNEGLQDKLLLVSAPAGFGKTTLISEWIATVDRPVAWLSLDERDGDPIRYWVHFIAALQSITPEIGKDLLSLLQSPQPPATDALLVSLLNEIGAMQDDFIVVLDDYHLVDNPSIDKDVDFLLKHLPPTMHLAMLTREDPQLPLASLRARHQMTEIRVSDLRFTLIEATDFINQTMGLSLTVDDISILEKRTEGWITGLQLAALALRRTQSSDTVNFIQQFNGSHQFVLDYLMEEILQHQPESIRQFLLQTSILERLCAQLCDVVTQQENSADILETLERGNMFLIPLDNRREWFRYHHLFADVLQTHLTKEASEQIAILHSRASEWYEQHRLIEDAIQHSILAKDFDRSARLIELKWSTIQQSFEYSAFIKWIRALPDEVIKRRPVLCVAYGWALIFHGGLKTADYWLKVAEHWLDADKLPDEVTANETEWHSLPATIAIARTMYAQASRNTKDVIKYANRALDILPADDHFHRAVISGIVGVADWEIGELDSAHQLLTDSMEYNLKRGGIYNAIGNVPVIAHINFTRGQLYEAIDTFERALKLAHSHSETPIKAVADLYLGLSALYLEQGELSTAEDYLRKSEDIGDHKASGVDIYRFRQVFARVKMIQGDLEGAVNLLDAAEQDYTPGIIPDLSPVSAIKARIWISQGRLKKANDWLRKRGISLDDQQSYLHEYEYITLARLLIAQYRDNGARDLVQQASRLLENLLATAEAGNRVASLIEILILQALVAQATEHIDDALGYLEQATQLAEPESYVQVFLDEGASISQLLGEMHKRNIMPAFTSRLLAMFDAKITDGKQSVKALTIQSLLEPLTERELDVLRLFKTELSGPEIARELVIALSTVRTHTKGIYRKLGVNNRRAAIKRAEELNML